MAEQVNIKSYMRKTASGKQVKVSQYRKKVSAAELGTNGQMRGVTPVKGQISQPKNKKSGLSIEEIKVLSPKLSSSINRNTKIAEQRITASVEKVLSKFEKNIPAILKKVTSK